MPHGHYKLLQDCVLLRFFQSFQFIHFLQLFQTSLTKLWKKNVLKQPQIEKQELEILMVSQSQHCNSLKKASTEGKTQSSFSHKFHVYFTAIAMLQGKKVSFVYSIPKCIRQVRSAIFPVTKCTPFVVNCSSSNLRLLQLLVTSAS